MYYKISLKQKARSHHHKQLLKMELGPVLLGVGVCFTYTCVSKCLSAKKKKPASLKVIPLVVWEFGKDPIILCRQWLHKARLWGCRYQCRTPAAKVTALSQITTVDPRNLSWCHQSVDSLKSQALSVTPVWRNEKRERGTEVTNHGEGLRNATEALQLSSLCCAAALWG